MRKNMFLLTLTLVLTLAAGSAWADAVTGLTTFTSGTPAVADEVNANFAEVADSVDDNNTRITNLQNSYAGTQYYVIGHHELTESQNTYSYTQNDVALNPTTGDFYYSNFHLPQGAIVQSVSAYVEDNDASSYVAFYVDRYTLDGSTSGILGSAATTGIFAGGNTIITDNVLSNNVIDNSTYMYSFKIKFTDPGTSPSFSSARITYTMP